MSARTASPVIEHTIGADGLLVLGVRSGDVTVRGGAGDRVCIRAADGGVLDGLHVEPGERSLTVRAGRGHGRSPGSGHGASQDLEVDVPAGATVVLEGGSSDVVVSGLVGDQRYRTASGDLTIRDAGGRVIAEAMSGDIRITADGRVRLELRTVSGGLSVRGGVIESVQATTTSGDLHVAGRFVGAGPFTLETVSGDAVVAPTNDVRIDLRTIAGDLHSELPGRTEAGGGRRSFIIGRGGPTIDVRSTSGDLEVVRALRPESSFPPAAAIDPAERTSSRTIPTIEAPMATGDAAALGVLRALEAGDIDVDEARRRLEAIDGEDEVKDHA